MAIEIIRLGSHIDVIHFVFVIFSVIPHDAKLPINRVGGKIKQLLEILLPIQKILFIVAFFTRFLLHEKEKEN